MGLEYIPEGPASSGPDVLEAPPLTSSVRLPVLLQLLSTARLGSCSVVITIHINTVATVIHKRRLYLQRIVQIVSILIVTLHKTLKVGIRIHPN